ncbi:MAG: ParB N-terminal domain-containing protein [Rhodospirillaceae bacterium]
MEPLLLKTHRIALDAVYVPVKRKKTLDAAKVDALAASIMEDRLKTPIHVRQDGDRLVLVEGLHRLEACRALGETEIDAILVRAKQH